MDISDNLSYSYEEQFFMQISKLKSSLLKEDYNELYIERWERHRIFKYNYFEDIDVSKTRSCERILKVSLKSLAEHLRGNMLASNRSLRTPTPLRECCDSSESSSSSRDPSPSPSLILNAVDQYQTPNTILLVDKDKNNYAYDKHGIIHLKPKKHIKFTPNKSRQALMLHVIAKVINLIGSDTYITQRQLYYLSKSFCKIARRKKQNSSQVPNSSSQAQVLSQLQNQSQLRSQNVDTTGNSRTNSSPQTSDAQVQYSTSKLDLVLNDLCCLLGCSKVHLHVLNQPKGLVYGDLRYKIKSGELLDCLTKKDGTTIPSASQTITFIESEAKFVLVLEKDSVFQNLLNQESNTRFVEKFKAILFTAKGYPDNTSKAFLNFLWLKLQIPILALTDADPHGFEIFCSYKFGTYQSAHENARLAIPQMRWLGILPTDLNKLSLPESKTMAQTIVDKKKLSSLQARPYLKCRPHLLEQLRLMQSLDRKAELESLDKSSEYLARTYLPNKLRYASWL